MSAPETEVISRGASVSTSPPLDTSQCFAIGLVEKGSTTKALGPFRNLDEVEAATGERAAYGSVWDFADVYFREGGAELYIARVVGATPVKASVKLKAGEEDTLTVTAVDAGAWGNDIDIVVTAEGGNFVIVVKYDGVTVETSPTLATNTAAVEWAESSEYIRLTDLAKGDPSAATKELASGVDDRENVTITQQKAALALFLKDLGPGQVCYPGGTTAAIHAALAEHAEDFNRFAVLDGADTATVATLSGTAATDRALSQARYAATFAPWVEVPGVASPTTRVVPPSALVCGLIARSDGAGNSPNIAAAGINGIARYATGLSQDPWDSADLDTLADAGVNVIRVRSGQVRVFDAVTLVDPDDPTWLQLPNARLNMAIVSEAEVIAENYLFSQLDGRGIKIGEFGGDLTGMLLRHHQAGALYGETPELAFNVETGEQVNPPADLAEGKLRAVLEVRMSPFARFVTIEILKTSITEAVA